MKILLAIDIIPPHCCDTAIPPYLLISFMCGPAGCHSKVQSLDLVWRNQFFISVKSDPAKYPVQGGDKNIANRLILLKV